MRGLRGLLYWEYGVLRSSAAFFFWNFMCLFGQAWMIPFFGLLMLAGTYLIPQIHRQAVNLVCCLFRKIDSRAEAICRF
jgi:hypothetical protein